MVLTTSNKEKKQRHEYKITLGKDWQGKLIRKSFYSTKSRADAKRKAEKYRAGYELRLLCGNEECHKKILFKDWAIQALDNYKKPYVKPILLPNQSVFQKSNELIKRRTRKNSMILHMRLLKTILTGCLSCYSWKPELAEASSWV